MTAPLAELPLAELIDRIRRHGPVPFSAYVDAALYGPEGFYTNGGGAGRGRDFLTSPEVGPLFGAVFGRALDALAEAPKVVMKTTRPTPIMSAAAVDAVRFGLRIAFSRASEPDIPPKRARGQPMIRAAGRAMTRPSILRSTATSFWGLSALRKENNKGQE